MAGPLPYVFQTSLGKRVEVDGDTAVHRTNMLGLFQHRGAKPTMGLTRRVNYLRREPGGWKITKTTTPPPDGGLSFAVEELGGNLNPLPDEMEARTPWTYSSD